MIMAKNEIIKIYCFDQEIGILGLDENAGKSYFQYNPTFLESSKFQNLFPETGILKKTSNKQVFNQFNNSTFKGIPPMFSDSLPDDFGNIIFKKWLESTNNKENISVLEQLAYVSNRGMGALEYKPSITLKSSDTINLNKIITVLQKVLESKNEASQPNLDHEALLNIFKIGTSAGGVRPKILISEHKKNRKIIPGDLNMSKEYNHLLVKLSLENTGYNRELIEYCYYLTATKYGINMMPSKLIDNKHFATERFDRIMGEKIHILSASGLTGWDFKTPDNSTYENLFELAVFLKLTHSEIDELFQRMIFNVIFCNTDDHLKNHSFIYDKTQDKWKLSPAYDLTYSLNPLMNYKRIQRALSINNKRVDITIKDILVIADKFTIKNVERYIQTAQNMIPYWEKEMNNHKLPKHVTKSIKKDFKLLIP